ncbi:glucoamylase (plasmid) [Streptomyces alboflavus]|uniref:Trehalase n=1 Tax=Streptomyces alboflavus TaxID=67267 RepID=A0A291W3Z1_9ACTN|nr:glycoside hydrolase family 15 protein [Streptomyces alboflavus]ATM24627.1 glucoamylase [Streptomyces alboflavus]
MAGRLEDYGLIGDLQTSAHVGRDGAVDWLCLPRFDSPAVCAALLGDEDNGFWRIGPSVAEGQTPPDATRRGYLGDSLILESQWDTPTGTVSVIDFMPPREGPPRLVRIVEAVTGSVSVTSEMRLRFGYGSITPLVTWPEGRMHAVAGPDSVWLDCDGGLRGEQEQFTLTAGQRMAFTLSWEPSHAPAPDILDTDEALEATEKFWAAWVAGCRYDGRYRAAVVRSLITLKALTYAPTGGIVAAPTTSLPEEIGGIRNWDYRYVWLRDAALIMASLLRTGYRAEARAWRAWLVRAVAGDPENLQIMYGVAGEREVPETVLPWLTGYQNSAPVRVGNAAAAQWQLDVYGEVLEALYLAATLGLEPDPSTSTLLVTLVETVEARWHEPDEGIWEIRGPRKQFVHSKVMAWVAVDRVIRLVEAGHAEGPVDRWRLLRDAIHQDVCDQGYDPVRNTFTQFYGSQGLDASLLMIALTGFLPADDKRVIGTVEAVQRELATPEGFVRRYATDGAAPAVDGLPGDEGAFLVCSFWLTDALARIGRHDDAQELYERLLAVSSDLGLMAEEWDPQRQQQTGNFPQGFTHIGVIDGALALDALTVGGEDR